MINRRSREQLLHIERPFVCVTGAVPPDILGDLHDERGREDGFIHRILFSYPDIELPPWTDAAPSPETIASFDDVFKKLFDVKRQVSVLPGRRIAVCFTDEGRARFIEFHDAHIEEMNDPAFPYALQGPWAKLKGYAARFALILQMARVAGGEAETEDVDDVSC